MAISIHFPEGSTILVIVDDGIQLTAFLTPTVYLEAISKPEKCLKWLFYTFLRLMNIS
jgi:hypothetical protein